MGAGMVSAAELEPHYTAGVEVEVVAGAGHFLHLEQHAAINARIVEFLTR
jgi:pimeloyl-ACP methyl ester carboxylesterase